MGPEAGLRARVLRALRHTRGTRVWGWPASALSGSGHPDLFGSACGRFFALELKTRTGRLTTRQKLELQNIRRAGGYAWEVRTVSQAERALACVLEGRHPPMAEEPFNIDDWFKDLDQTPVATEPETAPALEALPWDDAPAPSIQEQATADQNAFDLATGTATHEDVLADLDARGEALDSKPTVADAVAMRDAQKPKVSQGEVNEFIALVHKIDADVRASGDRTTMVYEELHNLRLELNVTRNVVQALEKSIRELIALVSDEEIHEEEPTPEPEPAPIPSRRRNRRS